MRTNDLMISTAYNDVAMTSPASPSSFQCADEEAGVIPIRVEHKLQSKDDNEMEEEEIKGAPSSPKRWLSSLKRQEEENMANDLFVTGGTAGGQPELIQEEDEDNFAGVLQQNAAQTSMFPTRGGFTNK